MCILCVLGVGEVAAWCPWVWRVLQPRILGGPQVLSQLQSCLSCCPGYHLLPPGGMGIQGMPVGPVGQLCSTRPPQVLMPTTRALSQRPLWESWLRWGREDSEGSTLRVQGLPGGTGMQGLLTKRGHSGMETSGPFDTKAPPAAETTRLLWPRFTSGDLFSPGCTTPDKMKCIPDIQNFPIKISLSGSPVRSET